MSDFQDVGSIVADVIATQLKRNFFYDAGECPECGSRMLVRWDKKLKKAIGKSACAACGYREPGNPEPSNQKLVEKWSAQARENDAQNYLTHASVTVEPDIFDKTLENFKVDTPKQQQAMKVARQTVADILAGQPAHCMLNGATGTGKSHLAMGILYAVMVESGYKKHCAFIDYRELLSQTKRGFNNDDARKMADMVTQEIKKADVVVIDDLGAEAGDANANYQASAWGTDVATGIFAARENKPTIITTNRIGKDLKRIYGDRVMSRIMHHIDGRVMLFNGMSDYRVKAI